MPIDFSLLGLESRPDKLPMALLNRLRSKARWIKPEDEAFANELYPEAGDYLSAGSINGFIVDEIHEEAVSVEIESNKKLLKRMTVLFPAISDFFSPPSMHAESFLIHLIDCCDDVQKLPGRARKDRQIREMLRNLESTSQHLSRSADLIGKISLAIGIDYDSYHNVYFDCRQIGTTNSLRLDTAESLVEQIRVFKSGLDIFAAKLHLDDREFFAISNNVKGFVVEQTHDMTTMWNGPPVITTPGSDFSTLCGLIYECATGISDTGLAGAINRYARSSKRRAREIEEREFIEEQANEDNFIEIKAKTRSALHIFDQCKAVLEHPTLDDFSRKLLTLKMRDCLREIDEASKTHGPLQAKMSHLTEAQRNEMMSGIRSSEESRTRDKEHQALRRELGNLRRQLRLAMARPTRV